MKATTPAGQDGIFISYRVGEAGLAADRLYHRLARHFGDDQVFYAPDAIRLAQNFVTVLSRALGSCRVLLALIGERWLTVADEQGRPRLFSPGDYVRMEIETALARPGVEVIPVLVGGARMPSAAELPRTMAGLSYLNALDLSVRHFDDDINKLLAELNRFIPRKVVVAAPAALLIPLFLLALRFLQHSHLLGDRVMVIASLAGCAVALIDRRRSAVWTGAAEAVLIWCALFAAYKLNVGHVRDIFPWNQSMGWSGSAGARLQTVFAAAGAAVTLGLLVATARGSRVRRRVHVLLPIFLGCMTAGLGLRAVAYAHGAAKVLEHAAGWFILAAFVADALVPLVALLRKLAAGRGSHAMTPPPAGAGTPTPPAPAGWN